MRIGNRQDDAHEKPSPVIMWSLYRRAVALLAERHAPSQFVREVLEHDDHVLWL